MVIPYSCAHSSNRADEKKGELSTQIVLGTPKTSAATQKSLMRIEVLSERDVLIGRHRRPEWSMIARAGMQCLSGPGMQRYSRVHAFILSGLTVVQLWATLVAIFRRGCRFFMTSSSI